MSDICAGRSDETEVKKILTEGNKTKRKSEINPNHAEGEDNKEKEDDDLA